MTKVDIIKPRTIFNQNMIASKFAFNRIKTVDF